MNSITRRAFLKSSVVLGLGLAVASCTPKLPPTLLPVAASATPVAASATPAVAATTRPTVARVSSPEKAAPSVTPPLASTAEPTSTPEPKPAVVVQTATPVLVAVAYLAVARGPSPEQITERAIDALGGMARFVKSGYDVIVKPNICNANHSYEYASTTNPEVVATLVKLCLGAGAKRVRVMDYPFSGSGQSAYARSGIEQAVKEAGGEMELMAKAKYVDTEMPQGLDLKSWRFYQPILDADLVINVPIAKHHSLARLTLGGKNLLGTIEDRGSMHRNLGQRIADLTSLVRPQLTVVDAVRILVNHGPTGGNLDDVKLTNTVIASHDIVAADAYATTLFGLSPRDISYIVASSEMGLGTMDLEQIDIAELNG